MSAVETQTTADEDHADSGRRRLWAAILAVVNAVVLHGLYVRIISPEYAYFGYSLSAVDAFNFGIALTLVAITAAMLPVTLRSPADLILWIVFVVAISPSIIVPHFGGPLDDSQALTLSIQSSAAFALVIAVSRWSPFKKKSFHLKTDSKLFWLGLAAWSLGVYALMIINFGIPTSAPSLDDVYGVRGDYKVALGGSAILGYLIPAQAGVVNPLMLARGIRNGSIAWLLFGLAGQLLIFATSGLKSVALSGVAVIGFYWIMERRVARGWVVGLGVSLISIVSVGLDSIRGTSFFSSLFVRRFLITPGLLAAAYVYTFGPIEKARWGYSFLSGLYDYPYSESPPYLVGSTYFDQDGMNANANFIADGFANWGFLGVLVEALVIAALLILINLTAAGLPKGVAAIMFVVPAIAFANSSAFTTASTHGVLFGILLAALTPRTGWAPARRDRRVGGPPASQRTPPSSRSSNT